MKRKGEERESETNPELLVQRGLDELRGDLVAVDHFDPTEKKTKVHREEERERAISGAKGEKERRRAGTRDSPNGSLIFEAISAGTFSTRFCAISCGVSPLAFCMAIPICADADVDPDPGREIPAACIDGEPIDAGELFRSGPPPCRIC